MSTQNNFSWSSSKDKKTSSTRIEARCEVTNRSYTLTLSPYSVKMMTQEKFQSIIDRLVKILEA